MACVYALSSSLDPGVVRYIGRSNKDSSIPRLKQHLEEAAGSVCTYKNNWVRGVLSAGGEIIALVLESRLTWEESGVREIFLIAQHKSLGSPLTNMTDGGDGVLGHVHSAKTREKMSVAQKGVPRGAPSVKHRANLSAALKGRTPSVKTRAAALAATIGKPLSPGHRAKISASGKGRKHSPETIENMREAARQRWAKYRADKSAA